MNNYNNNNNYSVLNQSDPFYVVQSNTFKDEEFKWWFKDLRQTLSDVEKDVKDLADSIVVVEKFPEKFGNISQQELDARRRFIKESRTTIDSVKNDITSIQTRQKLEDDKRSELLFTEKRHNIERESKYDGIRRAVDEDNQDFLRDNMQQQQQLFAQQDQGLDQIGEDIGILRNYAEVMNTELVSQAGYV
eukprot:gene20810-24994_t